MDGSGASHVNFAGDYSNESLTKVDSNVSVSYSLDWLKKEGGAHERSTRELSLIGVTLGVLDLLTILGNLLVCVTIASTRRLRNNTNYFIFSLALSDLLLGILVLPFSTLNTLLPEKWPLGSTFCNLFVSTDVMLCTVSILNLFAISLDRYFAVTKPYEYCRMTTTRRVITLLIVIWVFSFLMAFVPIHVGWNTAGGHIQNTLQPAYCLLDGNPYYVLLIAIGTYFLPLIIMCSVYIKVFSVVKQQVKRIKRMAISRHHFSTSNGEMHTLHTPDELATGQQTSSPSSHPRSSASESKATITLGSVVLAFIICWIPYFVMFTAKPFVANGIDPTLDLFGLWLGYVNSMLNPFLYAFINTEFRYGFTWVLCKKWVISQREKNPTSYFV